MAGGEGPCVVIDLDRIRRNVEDIRHRTERPVIAVIKADAYGLGAVQVAAAIEDLVDEFAYFSLAEARAVQRPGLILGPLSGPIAEHLRLGARPAVGSLSDLDFVGSAPAVLNIDTGMQRFGCRPEEIDEILEAGNITDAFTHTVDAAGARMLWRLCRGKGVRLHAAGTSLLHRKSAYLDAVRPGLAIYLGAMTVSTTLVAIRSLSGAAGYTRFHAKHAGVILCGYAGGFGPGIVRIRGKRRRVLEVGMNTSFVEVGPRDRVGDEVTLLGADLSERDAARALGCSAHEILCRYARTGNRHYVRTGDT